jgi:hypothetical protein
MQPSEGFKPSEGFYRFSELRAGRPKQKTTGYAGGRKELIERKSLR